MPWGLVWGGAAPWGIASSVAAPTLIGASPSLVARRGGDVIAIIGTGFVKYVLIEVLQAAQVVGTCYAFDADVLNDKDDGDLNLFSLAPTRIYAGTPALPDGVYDLRVTNDGGPSAVLASALTYELFSDEVKVHRVRQGLSRKWKAGRHLLTTNEALK